MADAARCPKHNAPWLDGDFHGRRRCTFYVPELGVSEDYGCPQPADCGCGKGDACNFGTHNHESIVDVKDGRLWCFTHQRPCPYELSQYAASDSDGKGADE